MKDNFVTSLIIPCYNEEVNIYKGVLDKIGNYTKYRSAIKEVVFIDDGSTDSSRKTIKQKYLRKFPKFKLLENRHQGKAFAIMTGIQKATAPYVLFSDFDLATPLEESEKLFKQARLGYQIVIGSRNSHRKGAPLLRKIMARGFIFIRDILIGLRGIKDTQCGFKLLKKRPALRILDRLKVFHQRRVARGSSVSAGFDLEFLFVALKLGYSVKEIPVKWLHVETKNVNFVKDSVETLTDIITIKYFDLLNKY